MRRRLSLASVAVVAALVLVLGLASGAPARIHGDVSGNDPAGDVNAKGLTKAEASAMDIVAVRVVGADNLGVLVTVTFAGNFEQRMGKGHLVHAAAALVLTPKPGKGSSAGLVTQGPGKVGKVYRETASTTVGSFRNGNKLTFFISGPGFGNVQSVYVETVASATGLGKARATSAASDAPPEIPPGYWKIFLKLHKVDYTPLDVDTSALSCDQLDSLLGAINDAISDPAADTGGLVALQVKVKTARANCAPPVAPPPAPPAVLGTLAWHFFSSNEVAGSGVFTGPATSFNSVRIVLPSGFVITDHLCPSQLPNVAISGNTIACGGGTLAVGQPFTLNLQTSPFPTPGMSGQLFGIGTEGAVSGPFTITGP